MSEFGNFSQNFTVKFTKKNDFNRLKFRFIHSCVYWNRSCSRHKRSSRLQRQLNNSRRTCRRFWCRVRYIFLRWCIWRTSQSFCNNGSFHPRKGMVRMNFTPISKRPISKRLLYLKMEVTENSRSAPIDNWIFTHAFTNGMLTSLKMGTSFLSNVIGTLVYLAAQFLGMFVAAAMSYWAYSETENAAYKSGTSSPAKDYAFSCLYSTCPTTEPSSHVKMHKSAQI